MTVSGDYYQDDFQAAETPRMFGLPMPTFLGWTIGLLGVLGAAGIITQLIMPLLEANNQAKTVLEEKEARLAQKEQIENQLKQAKAELVKVKKQKEQVMSLFANEKDLNTLLLDLNQLIEKNNAGVLAARQAKLASCPAEIRQQYTNLVLSQEFEEKIKGPLVAEAKLRKFKPDEKGTVVISEVGNDAYVQPALVGQLRRQTVEVEFEGNFNQNQSIFRTIERLQPLLIVKDLKVERKNAAGSDSAGLYASTGDGGVQFLTNCQPEVVTKTSFKLDALLPLQEVPTAAKPPAATPAAKPAQ
jgi:type IV pilus assembly protein PilO